MHSLAELWDEEAARLRERGLDPTECGRLLATPTPYATATSEPRVGPLGFDPPVAQDDWARAVNELVKTGAERKAERLSRQARRRSSGPPLATGPSQTDGSDIDGAVELLHYGLRGSRPEGDEALSDSSDDDTDSLPPLPPGQLSQESVLASQARARMSRDSVILV